MPHQHTDAAPEVQAPRAPPPPLPFSDDQLAAVEALIEAATENQGGPNATLAEAIVALGLEEAPTIDFEAADPFAGLVMDEETVRIKADWNYLRDQERNETVADEKIIDLGAARDNARRQHQGDGSRENPFRWKSAEVVEIVLAALSISIRWNIRAREIEFQDTSKDSDPRWLKATDRATSDLRERIATRFWHKPKTAPEAAPLRFSREGWKDALDAIAFHFEVDPFLLWLDDLPPWDGSTSDRTYPLRPVRCRG